MQKKISNQYEIAGLTEQLRVARERKGWSQRVLGERSRIPQSQISRIERGEVDLQLSTLLAIARALDLDLQLVPRTALPAVEAALRSAQDRASERRLRDVLRRLRDMAEEAESQVPGRQDIAMIARTLRDLEPLATEIGGGEFAAKMESLDILLKGFLTYPPAERPSHARSYEDMAAWLRDYRNHLFHGRGAARPAYSLDDED